MDGDGFDVLGISCALSAVVVSVHHGWSLGWKREVQSQGCLLSARLAGGEMECSRAVAGRRDRVEMVVSAEER